MFKELGQVSEKINISEMLSKALFGFAKQIQTCFFPSAFFISSCHIKRNFTI